MDNIETLRNKAVSNIALTCWVFVHETWQSVMWYSLPHCIRYLRGSGNGED